MYLNVTQLARMIDLSAVRADVELAEVKRRANVCRQYQCVCAFVMPCYMAELKKCLSDAPQVGLGGVVGFPSGAQSTAIKVADVLVRTFDRGVVVVNPAFDPVTVPLADLLPQVRGLQSVQVPGLAAEFLRKP